ncbi:CST complex subunit CTC1 isoform X1 [Pantherophis guttatus]|uniref:CST complex subunit CTC1 n=2 Tax=Pantherophis guttatus TaxID=94885 RepID=A0A6P9BGC8_PANGU|nr:CST complex subunit CTC1 isoform X1 [Pantherophis guttatus]
MESGHRQPLKRPRTPDRSTAARASSIISISDLQSQCIPCCSRLTSSSDEFREWTHQNETILPDQKYFEQTRLMLIGYLRSETPGKKDKMMDGSVYLQDNTGALPCVFLHFKLDWLEHLSLFPSWIYIPQKGEGTSGYLEILEDPIQVLSGPEKNLSTIPVLYPGTAADLLSARPQNKNTAKVNVAGELDRLTTILYFNQKSFFFLFLKCFSSSACVPVVIQKTPHLVWHHALQLGHRYVLTALKISCLKSAGQSVFRTSSSSCLLPYRKEQTKEQCLDVTSQGRSMVPVSIMPSIQPKSLLKVQKEEMILGPLRKSELISYTGTITQVLNAQAGLYELDNKHILCLAYQQMLNTGCGFRPGACIELRDVHLLEMPLPSIPAAFGACLHTTIVLKSFSAYSILHQPVNCFGNHYLQLLLRYNLSLSLYLYLVNLLEIFEQRFCCFTQHQKLLLCFSHHSQRLIEKFIVPILNSLLVPTKQERNFHAEILAEKHSCLLDQYQILEPPCQIPHFVELYSMVERSCWESCDPLQQLHSASKICNLNIQELNCRLAQNYCILSAECFHPPLLLLGVLEYSSSGSLQLRDRSNSLPCIIFHKDCRPFTDTSLIGCLLQVNIFQLITEQFPQNDLSSSQQPITANHIKKKKRLYAQFYFEDVKVLHVPEKRAKKSPTIYQQTSCDVKDSGSSTTDLRPSIRKAKRKGKETEEANTREPEHFRNSTEKITYVSRLFLLIQKEGLAWRNYLHSSESKSENGQTMQLCFQATILWMGKPKLCHSLGEREEQEELKIIAFEETSEAQQKVLLLFLKNSLHWFPFLHVDHLYQLILPQCTDLDIFDKKCSTLAPGNKYNLSCSFFLPFPDGAYVHHVRRISQPMSNILKREQKMFSIAEILNLSSKGSLVSFSGEIMERTLCDSHSGKKTEADACVQKKGGRLPWNYTVKLSVAPAHDSSILLDIYIQAAFVPYLWGLLPGARILFRDLQCKISRFGNIYCVFITSSDVCTLTPPPHNSPKHLDSTAKFSVGYLSNITLQPLNLGQAQVTCHLTCILSLSMQWFCDLCNISTERRPNECNNSCSSHTGMIKAIAKILVEDGTSEVMVFCKNQQVQQVLSLSPKEWEVMQNHIRIKGSVCIQHNEISTGARILEEQDLLTQYLRNLCRSPVVCRSIVLAFRVDRKSFKTGSGQLRRFFCNELEFLSRMRNRPNLICLNIQETI